MPSRVARRGVPTATEGGEVEEAPHLIPVKGSEELLDGGCEEGGEVRCCEGAEQRRSRRGWGRGGLTAIDVGLLSA